MAVKLDAFTMIESAADNVTKALEDFSGAINKNSTLLVDLEKARAEAEEAFEAQLDKVITEYIEKYQPNSDVQAQYYINKDNFIKKFRTEIKKSEYYLFSALFSYENYETLLDKKANVDKQFLNSEKTVDCSLLLTTSFNITSYAKDVDTTSESLVKGLNLLTDAIND
ncbi:hypothetical protein IJU97_00110 [bacterium]|nr:hypothetical protein [bacterium]